MADPKVKHGIIAGRKHIDDVKQVEDKPDRGLRPYGPELRDLWKKYAESKGGPKQPVEKPVSQETPKSQTNYEIHNPPDLQITADDEKLKVAILDEELELLKANALFLCIAEGMAYCIPCREKKAGHVKNSSSRGWSNGVEVEDPIKTRKCFVSHCYDHGKHVRNYLAKLRSLKEEPLQTRFESMLDAKVDQVALVLDCVYRAIFENMPMSKVSSLLDAVAKNCGAAEEFLRSESSHRRLGDFLADQVRESFATAIRDSGEGFSFSVDESTSQSTAKCLAATIRTCRNGEPVNFFLGLQKIIGAANTVNVFGVVQDFFKELGLGEEEIKKRLISFTSDGASVMQGGNNSLTQRLNELLDGKLISVHCFAHALELCFKDAAKSEPGVEYLLSVVRDINTLYRSSGPLKYNLETFADEKGLRVLSFLAIHDIRWAASLYRVLFNFLASLPAILEHFQQEMNGRSSNHKAKIQNLYSVAASVQFIEELLVFMQLLEPMAQASLELQRADITFVEAYEIIVGLRHHIGDLANKEIELWKKKIAKKEKLEAPEASAIKLNQGPEGRGPKWAPFRPNWRNYRASVIDHNTFGSVTLMANEKFKRIHLPHLITRFYDSLGTRLIDNKKNLDLYRNLERLELANIDKATFEGYGQAQLLWLEKNTNIVRPEVAVQVQVQLEAYIEQRRQMQPGADPSIDSEEFVELKKVIRRIKSISPTSAECERLFSLMNRVHTEYRNSFSTMSVSGAMMIRKNGVHPAIFDSKKAARILLGQKSVRRSTVEVQTTPELEKLFETWFWTQRDLAL